MRGMGQGLLGGLDGAKVSLACRNGVQAQDAG